MTDTSALFTAKIPPSLFAVQAPSASAPLGSTEGSGAISGGLLRPGSIDQTTFLQMLQQQQSNREAAGVGGKPVAMPVQGFQSAPSIPTLSSAQFAALVGAQNANPGLAGAPAEGLAADPTSDPRAVAAAQQAQALAQIQAQSRIAPAMAPSLKLSGAANRNTPPSPPNASGNAPASSQADPDTPTISRGAKPQLMAALDPAASGDDMPVITRNSTPSAAPIEGEGAEKKPAESDTETKGDPNVVHLKSPPDKEQITELRMRNKRWVVDETPGARQLFFGADGKFGWDDFLDMINPLQHIPGVAQIYRAVTGDEINGAANLIGAIPFGPLGGIGLIGAVAELAVKDVTGDDIGGNLVAMVFGRDESPKDGATPVPADMADAGESGRGTVQTASREIGYALSEASQLHEGCRG